MKLHPSSAQIRTKLLYGTGTGQKVGLGTSGMGQSHVPVVTYNLALVRTVYPINK